MDHLIRRPALPVGARVRASVPARLWQLGPPLAAAVRGPTRREFLIGAASLLVLGAVGCGAGEEGEPNENASGGTRTIEHKYGATEVSGTPERVVTVGLTEQDYVLALGLTPVGVREWFGGYPGALWPWARDELGDDPLPEVLPVDELNFEQIAALETDLILGVNSGLTEQEYETLSEVAPTVAQPKGYADYGAPWQEITRVVGRALGKQERAEGLIPPIEERFERAHAEHPEFEDSTGILATSIEGAAYVYAEGPAPRFLASLGLEVPPAVAELFSGADRAPVQLSLERLDLLDAADVVVLGVYGAEEASVATKPIYRQLDVAQEGRDILMPEMSLVNGALTFSSVLSLPIALDELVPRLAAAKDGDPDTEPEPIDSEAS
jgi:iron complex transport system substrate-binding protein